MGIILGAIGAGLTDAAQAAGQYVTGQQKLEEQKQAAISALNNTLTTQQQASDLDTQKNIAIAQSQRNATLAQNQTALQGAQQLNDQQTLDNWNQNNDIQNADGSTRAAKSISEIPEDNDLVAASPSVQQQNDNFVKAATASGAITAKDAATLNDKSELLSEKIQHAQDWLKVGMDKSQNVLMAALLRQSGMQTDGDKLTGQQTTVIGHLAGIAMTNNPKLSIQDAVTQASTSIAQTPSLLKNPIATGTSTMQPVTVGGKVIGQAANQQDAAALVAKYKQSAPAVSPSSQPQQSAPAVIQQAPVQRTPDQIQADNLAAEKAIEDGFVNTFAEAGKRIVDRSR